MHDKYATPLIKRGSDCNRVFLKKNSTRAIPLKSVWRQCIFWYRKKIPFGYRGVKNPHFGTGGSREKYRGVFKNGTGVKSSLYRGVNSGKNGTRWGENRGENPVTGVKSMKQWYRGSKIGEKSRFWHRGYRNFLPLFPPHFLMD